MKVVSCATGFVCLHNTDGTACADLLPASPLVLRIMMLLLCGIVYIVPIGFERTNMPGTGTLGAAEAIDVAKWRLV